MPLLEERVKALETELKHHATKADVERMALRLLVALATIAAAAIAAVQFLPEVGK